jgi:hypothetical protein
MVSKSMLDTVTIVFKEELPVLKVQAQSIDLYCQDIGIQTIFVVVNDDDQIVDQIDPSWWGSLSKCVRIIPRSFFNCEFVENGWVSQQVLKVLASSLSTNQYSMILDAKTIIVKEASIDLLFPNGKLAGGSYPIQPVFLTSARIVGELFNVTVDYNGGLSGVPFIVKNDLIRSMIIEIENLTKQLFSKWFQDQGMVTEFILYAGYCMYLYGTLDNVYSQIYPYRVINLCHSETGIIPNKLYDMTQNDTFTVSIHRRAWAVMTAEQRDTYKKFLISRNVKAAGELK